MEDNENHAPAVGCVRCTLRILLFNTLATQGFGLSKAALCWAQRVPTWLIHSVFAVLLALFLKLSLLLARAHNRLMLLYAAAGLVHKAWGGLEQPGRERDDFLAGLHPEHAPLDSADVHHRHQQLDVVHQHL